MCILGAEHMKMVDWNCMHMEPVWVWAEQHVVFDLLACHHGSSCSAATPPSRARPDSTLRQFEYMKQRQVHCLGCRCSCHVAVAFLTIYELEEVMGSGGVQRRCPARACK